MCDRELPVIVEGEILKAMVMPAMTCDLETAPIRKTENKNFDAVEIKLQKLMSGVIRLDRI